ncbi:Transposase [Shigella dysenteriae 1617]|uniref:Transposase n=1 Tax=Shigella dysenteriae 1617 TaxID=754093 RepID=A0A0A6ZWU8_SHIDY|nr:Transposase [Shigella dysenteriae 1617]
MAVKPGNTGSGTRITPKQGGGRGLHFGPVPMKPAGNYWHLLTPFNIGMITSDD